MFANRNRQGCQIAAWGFALAVLGFLQVQRLDAGVIFVPGKLVEGKFIPPQPDEAAAEPASPGFQYAIRYSRVSAEVAKEMATIKAAESITAPKDATQTICVVPLPAGTSAQNAALLSGTDVDHLSKVPGTQFLNAEAAQVLYETLVKQTHHVGFAACSGQPALVVPSLAIQGRMEFVLEIS
jgi:hypothetical protein